MRTARSVGLIAGLMALIGSFPSAMYGEDIQSTTPPSGWQRGWRWDQETEEWVEDLMVPENMRGSAITHSPLAAPPAELAEICPDGVIAGPAPNGQYGYWATRQHIPTGVTRRYCALVHPPYIPEGMHPHRLVFSWYDESDRDCGGLSVTIKQIGGAGVTKQTPPGSTLPNGLFHFTSGHYKNPTARPEETAPGVYQMTASGLTDYCNSYYVAWGASGDIAPLLE